jgi:hypothetical protein
MKKNMTYHNATVWFTVKSPCGKFSTRKCLNAADTKEAQRIAERLATCSSYSEIRIREAYTNNYVKYNP